MSWEVEGYDATIASIRKIKKDALFYMMHEDSLYNSYLPISSIKNYHIKPLSRTFRVDSNKLKTVFSVIDENKKTHVFLSTLNLKENRLKLTKLHINADGRFKRGFIEEGERDLRPFFIGISEDDTIHVRKLEGIDSIKKASIDYKNIKKGTIRPIICHGLFNYIFYITKDGKPIVHNTIFMYIPNMRMRIKREPNTKLYISSSSEHIQVYNPRKRLVIAGDKCLYGIYIISDENKEIHEIAKYPTNVSPQDIRKVLVKHDITDIYKCAYLLLTKDGKLWGRGSNIGGILGDYEGDEWEVVFENVDDIYNINDVMLGFFIKTRDNKLYYRGYDDVKEIGKMINPYVKKNFIVPSYIKKDVLPNTNLVAENVDTVIGNIGYEEKNIGERHYYSYFLDTNGNYLRGYANLQDHNNNIIKPWLGDIKKMEDVFSNSLRYPSSFLENICQGK